MKKTTTETTTTSKPCECGNWSITIDAADFEALPASKRDHYIADGEFRADDEGKWVELGTGCQAMTQKTFAPGHDAKLKSLLQIAYRHSADCHQHAGGIVRSTDAWSAASSFGFLEQVTHAPATKKARAPKAAKLAAVVVEPEPEPVPAAIKIGRWEYPLVVIEEGRALYQDRKGEQVWASAGTFTVITK